MSQGPSSSSARLSAVRSRSSLLGATGIRTRLRARWPWQRAYASASESARSLRRVRVAGIRVGPLSMVGRSNASGCGSSGRCGQSHQCFAYGGLRLRRSIGSSRRLDTPARPTPKCGQLETRNSRAATATTSTSVVSAKERTCSIVRWPRSAPGRRKSGRASRWFRTERTSKTGARSSWSLVSAGSGQLCRAEWSTSTTVLKGSRSPTARFPAIRSAERSRSGSIGAPARTRSSSASPRSQLGSPIARRIQIQVTERYLSTIAEASAEPRRLYPAAE